MAEKDNPSKKLCAQMRLWEFPDQYVIEPTDGSSGSCLSVSRTDGSMKHIDEIPDCSSLRVPKIQTVFGVIGTLKLLAGSYLLVVTERECIGSYKGHPIFKVSSLKVLPCDHSLKNTPVEQMQMETQLSAMLKVAEKTPGLYFSYNVNLTLSAQRLNDLGDESKLLPLWRQADPRFLWNNYMMEVLIDNKLDQYLLPIIQGSFNTFQVAIGRDIVDITLIARRCTRRIGTRLWRRGADSDGYVANFVETEQIIQCNGLTASFVQVRGSIPLLWDQIVDLTYKPKFELVRLEEAPRVAERHFLDLRKKYGNVLAVDLINKEKSEGRLCENFGNAMQNIVADDLRYLHFDFHHICGHIHFERLSMLYEQIEDFLVKNRYFFLNEKGEKVEQQIGVLRTNCIDCLDRTNVTQVIDFDEHIQEPYVVFHYFVLIVLPSKFTSARPSSMIGRKMLEFQLKRLGIFDADETIATHANFDENFKILWANHGDDVSIQYSGTPALKGDFVRFGQRTIQGIINDGYNALMRYYLNNFVDGTKQDAIDLLQGHFILSNARDMKPTPPKGGIEAIASLPLALGIICTGFFFAFISLSRVRHGFSNLIVSLIWASLSLVIAAFVKKNGRIFCNRPQLHQPRR